MCKVPVAQKKTPMLWGDSTSISGSALLLEGGISSGEMNNYECLIIPSIFGLPELFPETSGQLS